MASGWTLWVWLDCIGVVSRCCCIRRYIDILTITITFLYSTSICSFSTFPTPLLSAFHFYLLFWALN